MLACESNHQTVVQLLLKNKASIYCQDCRGLTAMHYAVKTGNSHLITLLTEGDAALIYMGDYAQR